MCLCSWFIEGQRRKLGNPLQDLTRQDVVVALASILDTGDTHPLGSVGPLVSLSKESVFPQPWLH